MNALLPLALLLICCLPAGNTQADTLHVAVASNFAPALEEITRQFEIESGHSVTISAASSGKLYAQIMHGAPYDAFFSADIHRPALLEQNLRVVDGSRFTYALGRLELWAPGIAPGKVCDQLLDNVSINHLAIANPKLAPYGLAAQQALHNLGLWKAWQGRLVFGENIGQTFAFVHSGAAVAGFIARSQTVQHSPGKPDCRWLVPATLHEPIAQQAVLLEDTPASQALFSFTRSEQVASMLQQLGYDLP